MIRTERTYGGGTHRVVTITESCPMAESARFVAQEREANRLLDLAIEETDAYRARDLIREALRLRRELACSSDA